MNVFVKMLSRKTYEGEGLQYDIKVEDNIGESIHIHEQHFRYEFSIDDFTKTVDNLSLALEEMEKWE